MRRQRFECFPYARQQLKKLRAVARHPSRFFCQTRNQQFRTRHNLILTDTRLTQRFKNDLQISHAGDLHVPQSSGRATALFKHRDRVLLVRSRFRGTDQRAVNVPEKNPHHSITARTSPAFTVSPGFTLIDTTTPARGDFISFCIFIASTTSTPAPLSTVAPASVCTRTTLPGMGATISATP